MSKFVQTEQFTVLDWEGSYLGTGASFSANCVTILGLKHTITINYPECGTRG